ncbi:MAG TPA: undecaprenyl-phosphate glucose phosphotransferase [Chitinophagaceae bacterium]|nr:undecaprenyl-phosphate glucose phosphotransferase [Chitinophagaceae bacterium]
MNRRFIRFLQASIAGLDLLTLNLAVTLTLVFISRIQPEFVNSYFRFWLFLNTSWLVLCWISAIYNEYHIMSFEIFARKSMRVYILWLAVIMMYLFFFRQNQLSRIFIISVILLSGSFLLLNRFIYLLLRHYFRHGEHLSRKVIILGYNDMAKKLATYLEEESLNTQIVGFCEEESNVHELSTYPILSNISDALMISKKLDINEIYSTIAPEQEKIIYDLIKQADQECIRFRIIPDLSFFIKQPVHINYLRDLPVLSMRSDPLDDVSSRGRKRFFDLIVSFMVIILILSWLIPLLGIIIWLESKGPIFFAQQRTGRDNKTFNCLKFRSMKINNEANTKQAERNDDRLTRIGKFMRRTSLDEFPQFINVFKGEMSIVGPRPHMLRHTEDYSKIMGQYMVRQFLKPGVTGWAQVHGYRGEIKDNEQLRKRIEHDIWYMENWNIWLDMRIMFLTVYRTVKGDENAF